MLACDTRRDSTVTAPLIAEVGTYTLQQYNGGALPGSLPQTQPNTTQQIVFDTLVLTSGGNVRDARYVRVTAPPDTSFVSPSVQAGRYTLVRDSITFSANLPLRSGRYSQGTLTLTDASGFQYVFRRR